MLKKNKKLLIAAISLMFLLLALLAFMPEKHDSEDGKQEDEAIKYTLPNDDSWYIEKELISEITDDYKVSLEYPVITSSKGIPDTAQINRTIKKDNEDGFNTALGLTIGAILPADFYLSYPQHKCVPSFNQLIAKVHANSKNYLSYSVSLFSWTCGVHGNGGLGGSVINMANQEVIHFDDIFIENAEDTLYKLVRDALCKDYGIPASYSFSGQCQDQNLYEVIEEKDSSVPSSWFKSGTSPEIRKNFENFYIDETGVIFIFSRYHIASYAEGEFQAKVSYDALISLLSEDFKNTLTYTN